MKRTRPGPSEVTPLARALLRWHRSRARPLPWRRSPTPYTVWISEILLQQTRVAQAVPYFKRFLERFPTLESLARAPLAEVLKAWQGAGYYARARNLHRCARLLRARGTDRLPSTVEELERLPGIGPYTARAIASQAFDVPVVALESNGLRVAARWTLERGDLRKAAVRRRLEEKLRVELPLQRAGEFNEAVMELGETVCTPRSPVCPQCPVSEYCRARGELKDPTEVPARTPRKPRPHVKAAVVVLEREGRWLVQRRPPGGFLGGLWEFPGGKMLDGETPEAAARRELREETGWEAGPLEFLGTVRHAYSHFTVELWSYRGPPGPRSADGRGSGRWVDAAGFERLPVPKATTLVAELARKAGASPGARPRTSARGRPRGPPHGGNL